MKIASSRRVGRFLDGCEAHISAIAEREPQRMVVVDARGTPNETHRQIVEVVRRKLKLPAKIA